MLEELLHVRAVRRHLAQELREAPLGDRAERAEPRPRRERRRARAAVARDDVACSVEAVLSEERLDAEVLEDPAVAERQEWLIHEPTVARCVADIEQQRRQADRERGAR